MILMQIGTLIFTTTGLLAFGMITAGFIKQMENLETEVGDELARGRKCLEKFRRLKKGLSPYLFAEGKEMFRKVPKVKKRFKSIPLC